MKVNEKIWETDKKPADIKILEEYEKKLNVKFPESYKKIAVRFQSGYSDNCLYLFSDGEEKMFSNLLSFDGDKYDDLILNYSRIKSVLVDNVIPFATDPFGNFICFRFENSKEIKDIVFWNHELSSEDREMSLVHICSTFEEFSNLLYQMDEDEDE